MTSSAGPAAPSATASSTASTASTATGITVTPAETMRAVLGTGVASEVAMATSAAGPRRRTVAYVVPAAGRAESGALTRRRLRDALPARLTPDTIVPVSAIPRDAAGRPVVAEMPDPHPPVAFENTPRDQWELSVADLWSRLLGLVEIGIDDRLGDLGAGVAVIEEMRAELADTFDAHVPAAELTLTTTVAELAPRVRAARGRSRTRHATLVPLNRDGAGTPLFCFGGAGGLALRMLGLAYHFRGERPVYGLQPHGLEARGLADWTVRAAALRHVRSIRGVQAHGPYLLLGHSFGGLVAQEAARLLTDAGERVALLTMVDAFAYDSPSIDAPLSLRAGAEEGMRPAAGSPPSAAAGTPGFEPSSRLGSAVPANRLQQLTGRVRKLAQLPVAGLVPLSYDHQLEVFFNQARIVTLSHRPSPWPGRALIYSADEANARGWLRYLTGIDVRTGVMMGDHDGILREPAVEYLAEDLRAAFAELGL